MKEKEIGLTNITATEINKEVNRGASSFFSLDDPALRKFAGKPKGEIKFSDFKGKKLQIKSWRFHEFDDRGKNSATLYHLNAYDKNGRLVFAMGQRSLDGQNNHYSGDCNAGMKDIDKVDLHWYRDTRSDGTAKMWLYVTDHEDKEHLILAYDKTKSAFKAHPARNESVKLGSESGSHRSYKIELKL